MVTHTEKKPFQCNHCDKAFSNKSQFKTLARNHINAATVIRLFHKIVLFIFIGRLKLAHTRTIPYRYSYCGKTFTQGTPLHIHLKSQTGVRLYQYNHFNKLFSQISYLWTHMRTHTAEKPYQYSYCSKAFSKRPHIQSHMKIQTR